MKNIRFAVVSALLAFIAATPAFGKSKKKKTSPAPAYHQPVISSVNGNAVTVSDEKGSRTFTITQFTEINVNNQRSTVADLKPGMNVNVTIGMDRSQASRINAEDAPAAGTGKKK